MKGAWMGDYKMMKLQAKEFKEKKCPICHSRTHFEGECESVGDLTSEYEEFD